MEDILNQLLLLNLEIEGAIRVLLARGGDEAKTLLLTKVSDFNTLIDTLICPEQKQSVVGEPFAGPISPAIDSPDNDPATDGADEPVSAPAADADVETVGESATDADDTPVGDTDVEPVGEPAADADDTPVGDTDDATGVEPATEPIFEPIFDMTSTSVTDPPITVADAASPHGLRVEDKLAMHESRSLNKAFRINDKFRFIRSIFADDRHDFELAIERLSQCQSLSDAYDYLLNERELDLDNEDVKDFLNILAVHFNAL